MAQAALVREEEKKRGKKPRLLLLKTRTAVNDPYELYFQSRGVYEPSFVPILETQLHPGNLSYVKNLFASGVAGEEYGGLIFTSQRAVEGLAVVMRDEEVRRAVEHSLLGSSRPFILYGIGPATYDALKTVQEAQLPHAEVLGSDAGTGEKLAELVLEHYNGLFSPGARAENMEKLPLLFLVGERHREVIPKTLMSHNLPVGRRINVEELVAYRTVVLESFETGFMRTIREAHLEHQGGGETKDRPVAWICIFSPAGCDTVIETLRRLPKERGDDEAAERGNTDVSSHIPRNCYIATIGPTTRDHLRSQFGIEADACADKPSPEGLGSAIDAYMEKRTE